MKDDANSNKCCMLYCERNNKTQKETFDNVKSVSFV